MSKTIVLPSAVPQQLPTAGQQANTQASQGFEQVGTIMKRMMANLARHGDMLHGEVYSQYTTHTPND